MEQLLSIRDMSKKFGGVCAINGFSLSLEKDAIHGLIGPNGAGKTTVFNLISGIYTPDQGAVSLSGGEITGREPHEIARMGISRTFQNIRLFTNLSVLRNVMIAGTRDLSYNMLDSFFRTGKYRKEEAELREKALHLLEFVGLRELAEARAGSLPYGHQRRLEIARSIAMEPSVLLLDEPAAGMNAAESGELIGFIQKLKKRFGLTILLIEHHMDVVSGLCDRVTVLNFGETIFEGTVEEAKRDHRVVQAYLGEAG